MISLRPLNISTLPHFHVLLRNLLDIRAAAAVQSRFDA